MGWTGVAMVPEHLAPTTRVGTETPTALTTAPTS